jgi:hypothetical protein
MIVSHTPQKKKKNLGKAKARLMNQSTRRLTSHFKLSLSPKILAKEKFFSQTTIVVVVNAKKERAMAFERKV